MPCTDPVVAGLTGAVAAGLAVAGGRLSWVIATLALRRVSRQSRAAEFVGDLDQGVR